MEKNKGKPASAELPYVNNIRSILFTVILTAVCILLFTWNRTMGLTTVIISTVACGFSAAFIDTPLAAKVVGKMRADGKLPANVLQSKLITRLPKNPVLLGLLFALSFSALAVLLDLALIRFYEIQTFTLARLIVYHVVLSCVLSAVISECAVLHYVQPNCAKAADPAQTGLVKVKNPMSRVDALKNWLGTILVDFGFNMIVGLVFGATRVASDHSVIINPTTRDGIVAASVVIGIIVTFRMAYPIMRSLYDAWENGQLPPAAKKNGLLSALPMKPMRLTLTLMLPIILLSFIVFWSVLTFFDFAELSFFQFFVIRSAYTAILSKGVVALATVRYLQPSKKNI